MGQDGGPEAALRLGPEAGLLVRDVDDGLQALFGDEVAVLHEAAAGGDLPVVAADGPVQQQALCALRVPRAEGDADGAAHTAAEHESLVDVQVVEQAGGFVGVEAPAQRFDAAAGGAGFAAVVGDAGVVLAQHAEGVHLRPDAGGAELVDGGVEAAGGEHEQRRAGAVGLVVDLDAVDLRSGHGGSSARGRSAGTLEIVVRWTPYCHRPRRLTARAVVSALRRPAQGSLEHPGLKAGASKAAHEAIGRLWHETQYGPIADQPRRQPARYAGDDRTDEGAALRRAARCRPGRQGEAGGQRRGAPAAGERRRHRQRRRVHEGAAAWAG